MKIIIIEDERITAADLQQTLKQIDPSIEVTSIIHSVREGLAYFSENKKPDLIFSDIRLGDGLSFEIINVLQVPVIFCTAYDEYALNAFNANGIAYILKPFTEDSVREAIVKYRNLVGTGQQEIIAKQYEALTNMFPLFSKPKISSLLVHHKDIVLPIRMIDVAMVYLKNNLVYLCTFDERTYYPNKGLDELEQLMGEQFFRVNRQYLVNRKAVTHASSLLSRKMSLAVSVPHDEIITISREKSPQFLKWLQESE
ncbi:response regulator transcription factor [Sphingobacterium alkalisoli]|uniref:Response regulator transcription factor n=1 Tax=Sphingobacterium alkalisoli TaxID=1874115 RepID=A0A4U0H5S1_9SPHI|nr:LytTR family DNA-binding domain-containing protein [Sphingobacterium alkalisoli]TJY67107.1 response regulator transcription factor [Sphingobacterium alkalisoli]GGH12181.1 DNA-binding response regulator [Sphingobacterium alkalisoli]